MNEDRYLGKFRGQDVRLENGLVVAVLPTGNETACEPRTWEFNGTFLNWLRRRDVVFIDEMEGSR